MISGEIETWRSELELSLDDAAPNIRAAVASFAAVIASVAVVQLLAGHPEHCLLYTSPSPRD